MERCTNANLSMFPLGLICTKSEVMFYTRLRFVEFKEIVWSDGRMTDRLVDRLVHFRVIMMHLRNAA